jgi:hypothetical protein
MATCPECGAEVKEDDIYCTSCGASLTAEKKVLRPEEKRARERDACFGEREADYSGLFSFGFLIIIVGVVFTLNPGVFSDFGSWIESMASQGSLVRPPEGLITSAWVFFGLTGVSNFVMAGVRLAVYGSARRAMSDALSGVALILFAYLISLYGSRSIGWQTVLAIEAVAVGSLVVLYSVVRYAVLKKG